ncbi:hypothetical protein [Alteraurantiacibacter aquimixticola]|uniref:Uncharacterized protein n=1 Tax=Alteraurantiacibacter aquimixticola TaxID=2489173 RepID=A0A4T3F3Y7_9SPHN|nr:hypothetical protein [Alteraurantiacibacter aquimixticola]TIX51963.1 hypothetical protein E5222_05895 [Alteraurantiacibacter aquimixticola]
MRRALVLTNEAARHPFRASLPMFVFAIGEMENRRSWRLNFGLNVNDARHFAATYVASFVAVSTFIA